MPVKGYKLPVVKGIISRNLMRNILIIVNNTIVYTWKLLIEKILNVLTTKNSNYVM